MIPFILIIWSGLTLLYLIRPRIAIIVYLLTLPVFPFYWAPFFMQPFNDLSVQRVVGIGITIGILLETVHHMQTKRLDINRWRLELLIAAMVMVWSISVFDIGSFSNGLRKSVFNLIDFWTPFVLGLRLVFDCSSESYESGISFFFRWLAWPSLVVAALTVYEYVVQLPIAWLWFNSLHSSPIGDMWSPAIRADVLRVQATLGQSIFLASYLVCTGLMALTLSHGIRGKGQILGYAVSIVLLLSSLLPMSRGAMLSAVISLFVMIFFVKGHVRWWMIGGFVVMGFILGFVATIFANTSSFWMDFLLTLIGRASGDVQSSQLSNYEYRNEIVGVAFDIMFNGPILGYGDVSVYGTWPIIDVTNVFLQVGITSGLVGLAMLVLLFVITAFKLFQLWSFERATTNYLLVCGLIVVYIVIIMTWLNSSWPGQFAQIGWMSFGVIHGWYQLKHYAQYKSVKQFPHVLSVQPLYRIGKR